MEFGIQAGASSDLRLLGQKLNSDRGPLGLSASKRRSRWLDKAIDRDPAARHEALNDLDHPQRRVILALAGRPRVMATNTRETPAVPEHVWAVLVDPEKSSEWVVGAKEVRGSESNWPSKAARFHHTVGVWPFHLRDLTSVVESDRPDRLLLQAKVRPIGSARIALELSPSASGSQAAMTEEPSAPSIARMTRRLFDSVILVRTGEALRRLENLLRQVDP